VKTGTGAKEAIRVSVRTASGRPVPHIDIELQTDKAPELQRTDGSGDAMFQPSSGSKKFAIRVPVYQAEFGPFAVDAATNDIVFEINGEAITHVPFKNERLKIAGSSLEMSFWDKDKMMRYRKQR
jgi:hypothetical protein